MFVEVDGVLQAAPAPRFDRTPASIASAPPAVGAHTDDVLAAAGVTPTELAALRAASVIA